MNWHSIESMEDLATAIALSNQKTVVLFKHSTRCPVSSMAKRVLESQWNFNDVLVPYHLDLLKHRDVSDRIASFFDIRHESPQMIVLQNEKAIFHASHMAINTHFLASIT